MQFDNLDVRLAALQYALAGNEKAPPTSELIERAQAVYNFLTADGPRQEKDERNKMN